MTTMMVVPRRPLLSLADFTRHMKMARVLRVDWRLSHHGRDVVWEMVRWSEAFSDWKISIDRILRVCAVHYRDVWSEQPFAIRADPRDRNFGEINREVFDLICRQLGLPTFKWSV